MNERHQYVLTAYVLIVLSAAAPLLDDSMAWWPLNAAAALIAGIMVWAALDDEPIAGPVVVLVLVAMPPMWASDRLALGSLTGALLAIMLGELLAMARASRYSTPGAGDPAATARTPLAHASAAGAAMAVTLLATALPEARWFSLTAIVALVIVTAGLHRRRMEVPEVPLPPPTRLVD